MTRDGKMLSNFERYPLTFGPTPIEKLERLTAHLGGDVELFAKREDCNSGLAFGGNKVRKLEYIVPDAIKAGADTLVTVGGVQSNHTRQVAAVAAKIGMKCRLVQESWVPFQDAVYDRVGNILMSRVMGAEIELVDEGFDIGIRDFTAVWGAIHHGRWIEYLFYREFSELSMIEVLSRLIDEFPQYRWGECALPHDAKNRDKGTGISVESIVRDKWPGSVYQVKAAPNPIHTLQATRKNMSIAQFDERGTELGITRLKAARYIVAPKTGTVTDAILHDDCSHCLDAFRLGMWRLEMLGTQESNREITGQDWKLPATYFS